MTLYKKVVLIVLAIFLSLMAVFHLFAFVFLRDSYTKLEHQIVEQNVQRALSALYDDISALSATAYDYAWWDDTYQFMEDHNSDYIHSNFVESTFMKSNLSLIMLVSAKGQAVFHREYDSGTGRFDQQSPIIKDLMANPRFLGQLQKSAEVAGLMALPSGPLMIVAKPILTSDGQGEGRGMLVMGRRLNEVEVKRLALKTHLSLAVDSLNGLKNYLQVTGAENFGAKSIQVKALNQKTVAGYVGLQDIYGTPILGLKVEMERKIYQQGLEAIRFFIFGLFLCSMIICGVIILLLRRVVLGRLGRLNDDVSKIGQSGDFTGRVTVEGQDELSNLGTSINNMLAALENFHENEERYVALLNDLSTAHEQVKEIIDFLPDPTMVIDTNHRVISWNNAMEEMTGITKEEILGKGDYAYVIPFYGKSRPALIDAVITQDQITSSEYEYITRRGSTLSAEVFAPALYGNGGHLMVTASPLFDNRGKIVGAIESLRDITERKAVEERQRYISTHDALTGFYNRTYFEQLLNELDEGTNKPFGIIMCDVDGLRQVNDTLGHEKGNQLLLAAAGLMRKNLTAGDTIARVGGDEFAILLPKRTLTSVEDIFYRIRNSVDEYNRNNPKLHLSMATGYAVSSALSRFTDVYKEADNNMCREKLHHIQSNRSSVVQTMMKALEARDFVTEGHAERMQDLVGKVGEALDLGERRIADLRLLAQFHDIGKVGTPDRILFKQGPLNNEEYTEMKRHCEIGYEIALSAPELRPIAAWILKHHERWDGKGYPLGLKGEEIPLECRIIALADAYDAMINDRPYRKALSQTQAVEELLKCAGTQFDPELVSEFCAVLKSYEASDLLSDAS